MYAVKPIGDTKLLGPLRRQSTGIVWALITIASAVTLVACSKPNQETKPGRGLDLLIAPASERFAPGQQIKLLVKLSNNGRDAVLAHDAFILGTPFLKVRVYYQDGTEIPYEGPVAQPFQPHLLLLYPGGFIGREIALTGPPFPDLTSVGSAYDMRRKGRYFVDALYSMGPELTADEQSLHSQGVIPAKDVTSNKAVVEVR